jgi:transcriptional regulator with XRE-family HTH domain
MPTREGLSAIGTARGRRLCREFGEEIRHARLAAGLSQASVASAADMSQETISRYELGQAPHPDLLQAARVARMLGLELSVRCFPAAGQLRDVAHVALIRRFLSRLDPRIGRRLEAPVAPGDQRAWDVLVIAHDVRIGVIAETRIRDLQALFRREHLKQVDGNVQHVLLLVANTKNNRTAIREADGLVNEAFPLSSRAVLGALGRGEAPRANGVVIL